MPTLRKEARLNMSDARPRLKVVCICRGGNVRSVAMKMILNRYLDHSTLACGTQNNDEATIRMLCEWADKVVLMSEKLLLPFMLEEYFAKLCIFEVGDDIWGNPFDEDLQVRIAEKLNAESRLFNFGRTINPEKVRRTLRQYREKIDARNLEDVAQ